MLANLAHMRKTAFSAERDDIMATWGRKGALPWGDQDVLNVYLNGHRDQAYVLPCKFNVRCAQLLTVRMLYMRLPREWVQSPRSLWLQPLELLHDMLRAARGSYSSLTILHLWPASSSVVLLFLGCLHLVFLLLAVPLFLVRSLSVAACAECRILTLPLLPLCDVLNWLWASHNIEANMVVTISHRQSAGCNSTLNMTVETEVWVGWTA